MGNSINNCIHHGWLNFHVLNRFGRSAPVILASLRVRHLVILPGASLNHINGDNINFKNLITLVFCLEACRLDQSHLRESWWLTPLVTLCSVPVARCCNQHHGRRTHP